MKAGWHDCLAGLSPLPAGLLDEHSLATARPAR